MADLNQSYLMQQQEILREIRDEIRLGRAGSGAVPGMSGGGVSASRPSNAFVRAQLAMDSETSQSWSKFGWTDAYKPYVTSSIPTAILASYGLRRAPQTMTQMELEQMAPELGWGQVASLPARLIARGSHRRIEDRARSLYDMSSRFLRAGDAGAGLFGHGTDLSVARNLSRSMEIEAQTDLRFTSADYGTILQGGLQSGQFDFARSMSDLKSQFDSLKDTIGDLTRVTRMSTDQISQSMGAMRQFGILDPADQARAIMQIDASARVAGVSSAVMAQTVQGAMGRAVTVGMHAGSAGVLAGGNLAAARAMSRAGLISTAVVAAGGDVQSISDQITSSQQAFFGSETGLMMLAGGLGRGVGGPEALFGTMGRMGGFQGYMGLQANRIDIMKELTENPAVMDRAYRDYVGMQVKMMGVDPMSTQGQHAAFMLLRGQMGDAAATTYTRQNFTEAGRAQYAQTQFATHVYRAQRESALAQDYEYLQSSPMVNMRRTFMALRSIPTRLAAWAGNAMEYDAGDRYLRSARMIASGVIPDTVDSMDQAGALQRLLSPGGALSPEGGSGPVFMRQNFDYNKQANRIATLMMTGVGIGTVAGIPGMLGGAAIGLGVGLGDAAWNLFNDPPPATVMGLKDLAGFGALTQAAGSRHISSRARALVGGAAPHKGQHKSLADNAQFQSLIRSGLDFRNLTGAGLTNVQNTIDQIHGETGESVSDIVGALKLHGAEFDLSRFSQKGTASEEQVFANIAAVLKDTGIEGAALATGAGASAMHAFYSALNTDDIKAEAAARKNLAENFGIKSPGANALRDKFMSMDAADRGAEIAGLAGSKSFAGDRSLTRHLGHLQTFAVSSLLPGEAHARDIIAGMTAEAFGKALFGGDGEHAGLVQNTLRDDAFFGTIIDFSAADAGTLMGMSDAEIAKMSKGSLTAGQIATLRRRSGGDASLFKNALSNVVSSPTGLQQAAGMSGTELKASQAISDAASILRGLLKDLKITSSSVETA